MELRNDFEFENFIQKAILSNKSDHLQSMENSVTENPPSQHSLFPLTWKGLIEMSLANVILLYMNIRLNSRHFSKLY